MTAAYLFYAPQFRPLTPAGGIMPNSYLTFLETGTTDLADVYADADLQTPLANPVVANAAGEFPAIYLDPATTYRVWLHDEDDALVWDIDPLAPPREAPIGTVVMFFGDATARDAAYPPALWQVCDGTNGSPDLRDRVPMGCSGDLAPGDTGGGSGTTNTSSDGAHDHGGTVSPEALSEAQMPAHNHALLGDNNAVGTSTHGLGNAISRSVAGRSAAVTTAYYNDAGFGGQLVEDAGSGDTHAHDVTEDGTHSHTVDTTPPFLALWFLYKKA